MDKTTNRCSLDRLGISASTICAIHCLLMPFIVASLPIAGLTLLADERLEWAFVGVSLAIGVLSLVPSWLHQHKRIRPLTVFLIGISLICTARFFFAENQEIEIPVVVLGALFIAGAHWLNRKLCQACHVCETD